MNVLVTYITIVNLIYLINAYVPGIKYEGLKEHDKCTMAPGSNGTCRYRNKCPHLVNGKIQGKVPKTCRTSGNPVFQKICCPTEPPIQRDCGLKGNVIASQTFIQFFKSVQSSKGPFITSPVVGGNNSRYTWPWMVLLGNATDGMDDPQFFCNGVLINGRFVLTAAHCVQEDNVAFFLRLGEYDYKNTGDGARPRDIGVESIIIHPKYDANLGYDDLAIVKLSEKIVFTDTMRPICLPWDVYSHHDLVNTEVTLTGWGAKYYNGGPSHILQEVNVTIFNSSKCDKSYSTLLDYELLFPQGINLENTVCAGSIDGGKDSCQGDSGGPLVHLRPGTNKYYLAGIVSRGYGCGFREFPGLYTPVMNRFNLQWIRYVAFRQN